VGNGKILYCYGNLISNFLLWSTRPCQYILTKKIFLLLFSSTLLVWFSMKCHEVKFSVNQLSCDVVTKFWVSGIHFHFYCVENRARHASLMQIIMISTLKFVMLTEKIKLSIAWFLLIFWRLFLLRHFMILLFVEERWVAPLNKEIFFGKEINLFAVEIYV
jgi:hypothetical protein